jgi:hypothetical protein
MIPLHHFNRSAAHRSSPRAAAVLWQRVALAMVAIASVLVTGCRPSLESLHVEPRLTFEELEKGKVAVLPLSAKIREVTLRDLERLDAIYAYAFDQHAHGIRRVPSRVVLAALESNYTNWDTVVRFADTHRADYEALQWLSIAVGARYLIFSRIEYAEIYDTSQSFTQLAAMKSGSIPVTCGPAKDALAVTTRVPRAMWSTRQSMADFSANICSTSQVAGFVTVVDARTGTAPWAAAHRISRTVGNSRFESNPVPLAWALFTDIFERMPEPD